jgi:hypothetical protein
MPNAGNKVIKTKSNQPKENRQRTESSNARLSDLCPEDKAKIGELVKKLATETKQKLEQQNKHEEERKQMERRIHELTLKQSQFEQERENMASKFQQSLQMLQELKHSHETLTQSNASKDREMKQERERFNSQTKDLKESLVKQYHDEVKHVQSSYIKKFDQLTDRSNNHSANQISLVDQKTNQNSQQNTSRSASQEPEQAKEEEESQQDLPAKQNDDQIKLTALTKQHQLHHRIGTNSSQCTLLQNSVSTQQNFGENTNSMNLLEIEGTITNRGNTERTETGGQLESDVQNLKNIQEDLIAKLRETESLISSISSK